MIAYQVAFDIEDNATQEFCNRVKAELPAAPVAITEVVLAAPAVDANTMDVDVAAPLLVFVSNR